MKKNLSNYFNNIINEFSAHSNQPLKVTFYENGFKQLLRELKNSLPFSKLAIVAKESTFLAVGKPLVKSLEKQGHKVITVLYNEKSFYSIDDSLALFSLPEDVRATVLLDGGLATINNYFVCNKKIETYFIPFSVDGFNLFSNEIALRNGEKIDFISLKNLEIKVFLAEENLKTETSKLFAELFCGLVSFYDYRIYGFITGNKLNSTIFNTATKTIMEGYSAVRTKEKLSKLVVAYFTTCLANAFTKGEICSYSSVSVLQEMVGNSTAIKLYSALTILQLYALYFNSETDQLLPQPNYTDIAGFLSKKNKVEEKFILNSIKTQLENISLKNIVELKNKLKKEIKNITLIKENILGHFAFLNGKTPTDEELIEINKYMVFAGDFYPIPNGLSVLREEGVFNLN